MIKTIRLPAEKVYAKEKIEYKKWKDYDEREEKIKEKEDLVSKRLFEIQKAESLIEKIQSELANNLQNISNKEKFLNQKETELKNMANAWKKLNEIRLEDLDKDKMKETIKGQNGFVGELIGAYVASKEREKILMEEIDAIMKELDRMQK